MLIDMESSYNVAGQCLYDLEVILTRLLPIPENVYGPLTNVGSRLKRQCPFPNHADKTASFKVNPKNLRFKCFGCNKKGDIFDFIKQTVGVTFPEAVKILADKAGVLPYTLGVSFESSRLYEINAATKDFYISVLEQNEPIKKYLFEKKISQASIKEFDLGCTNSNGIKSLVDYLKKKGFTNDEMLLAGVAVNTDERGIRDFFSGNMIILPISKDEKVRGFARHQIKQRDTAIPHFINNKKTPIFSVKGILFGLNSHVVKKMDCAIVVEEYGSVITCHQYGYRNASATMESSMTGEQIDLLMKITKYIYIVFDNEAKGKPSAAKSAKRLFDKRANGYVVVLPKDESIDSFLRKGGDLGRLIDKAMPASAFLVKNFPNTIKMMHHEIRMRDRFEINRFLACLKTEDEKSEFIDLDFLYWLEKRLLTIPCILKDGELEVKQFGEDLMLLENDSFWWHEEIKDEVKNQGQEMIAEFRKLSEKGKRFRENNTNSPGKL